MRTSHGVRPRRPTHVLVAAVLLSAFGCVEERDVAWLPDSSGFVYADKKGTRLVHYDLGKKTRRVISDQASRVGHAVSPDGKCLAAARCELTATAGSRKETRTVVVTILDREGREQGRSKALEVEKRLDTPADKSETLDLEFPVCWEGHPDRLLTPFGIYDRTADRWVKLPAIPAVFMVPGCPPTTRGFLAMHAQDTETKGGAPGGKDEWKVSFVDWDGWASDFKEPVKERGRAVAGSWDDRIWRLVTTGGVYSFDTVALRHEFTKTPDKAWDALGRPAQFHRFAGTDLVLTAFERVVDPKGYETAHRLDLHSLGKQRRRVVYAEGEYTGLWLYPSPNGKLAAVRCSHPGVEADLVSEPDGRVRYVPRVPPLPPKNEIVVFDDTGKVVATVKPE